MAAAADTKIFQAALVTPEALVAEAPVTAVQFPAHDGMIGILTHRAPLLTKLGTGVLTLNPPDQAPRRFVVSGGYAQMKDNVLTILSDLAIPAEQVTPEMIAEQSAELAAVTGTDAAAGARRQLLQARLAAMRGAQG